MLATHADWSAARASSFKRDGFFTFERFLGKRAVRMLRASVDAMLRCGGGVKDEEWVLGLHETLAPDRNWMWSLAREVSPIAAAILGEPVALYCSQISCKSPAAPSGAPRSKRVPCHQDCRGDGGVVTFWIALDRVDASNGGMWFERGGHAAGRRPLIPLRSTADLAAAQRNARYNVFHAAGDPTHEVRLPCGGATVHHPHLPHASAPNGHRFRRRRAIILRFMAAADVAPAPPPVVAAGDVKSSDGRSREQRALPISRSAPYPATYVEPGR